MNSNFTNISYLKVSLSISILRSSIWFRFHLKSISSWRTEFDWTTTDSRGRWVSQPIDPRWTPKATELRMKEFHSCLPKHFIIDIKERLPFITFKNNLPIHFLYENRKGRYLNSFLIRHFFYDDKSLSRGKKCSVWHF